MAEEFTATLAQAAKDSSLPLACGLGAPRPVEHAAESAGQALHAHAIARAYNATVLRYSDMGASALLEKTFTTETMRDLAAVLRPLGDHGPRGADALRAPQTFLAENGNIHRTASTLNVHRHTVRQRLSYAETVTGLDMDNADDRAGPGLAGLQDDLDAAEPHTWTTTTRGVSSPIAHGFILTRSDRTGPPGSCGGAGRTGAAPSRGQLMKCGWPVISRRS